MEARSDSFADLLERITGQPVNRCFQCMKCSGGCPVNRVTDRQVHEIIRLAQLGRTQEILESRQIWLCTGCQTCRQRCPNDIDASRVMDGVKALALEGGAAIGDRRIAAFHRAFLAAVKLLGRAHELGMIMVYKLRTSTYFQDLDMGIKMLGRGKFKFMPSRIRGAGQVAGLFRKARERKA